MTPADGPQPDGRSGYARLLRLRHVEPSGWQRAVLAEGSLLVGVLLALAELVSAWTVVVLPVTVAVVVKAHDLLQGELDRQGRPGTPTAPTPEGTGADGRD